MTASEFDEITFFRALQDSGAQALLIGRRALVLLGLPVLTADYDFWIAVDDIDTFNATGQRFGLIPTRSVNEGRRRRRYVLENDEQFDVLVARTVSTPTGAGLNFEDAWRRRRAIAVAPDVTVNLPTIEDLIVTKQIGSRPKDLEDVRLLRVLQSEGTGGGQ